MDALSIVVLSATDVGISAGEVAGWLSALGVGGVITTIVTKWLNRNKDDAATKEILTRTNRSISEIVEQQTEQIKADYKAALERIDTLEKKVADLKLELESDRQAMKIRSLQADVRFYKSRIEILEAQNMSMLETIKRDNLEG